jgi:hypothetical protein
VVVFESIATLPSGNLASLLIYTYPTSPENASV